MPKHQLPPHLQTLFNPRPPLPFLKPPAKNKCRAYAGIAEYVDLFEEDMLEEGSAYTELDQTQQDPEEAKPQEAWNPQALGLQTDPLKTLFVCRLNFETNERRLRREFEVFGPVVSVNIVKDKEGKSRGYAFIEFANEKDFKNAYKQADGRKIDGRKVVVDCERGRTAADWRPRRLGGGKGNTRETKGKRQRIKKKKEKVETAPVKRGPGPRSRSPRSFGNPRNDSFKRFEPRDDRRDFRRDDRMPPRRDDHSDNRRDDRRPERRDFRRPERRDDRRDFRRDDRF
jgi:U1 small nuclear ribonucleoprotein